MEEQGVKIDYSTLNHRVVDYSPSISAQAQKCKRADVASWQMDENYGKVKGKWDCFYCAVYKFGDTIDFMLSDQFDEMAATTFFKQADRQQWLSP